MRKVTLFVCFLCCYVFVFSQSSYINSNGKTIQGTIQNYKEWNRNPTQVEFQESATGSVVILTPQNCIGFASGWDTFISYKGSRIENTDDAMTVSGYKSADIKRDSIQVFLRQIYRYGNYALYKLLDGVRINFYFSDNGDIQELQYYEYVKEDENDINKNKIIPYEGYKQYLSQVLSDKSTQNLSGKLSTLSYKENDLINFLASVFDDKASATRKRRDHYPAEIFVGAGINANFTSLYYSNGIASFKQTSYAPSVEVGLRLYAQRNFGKVFFQPSLTGTTLNSKFNNDIFKLRATLLGANLGVGYMFIKQKNISVFAVANGSLYIPIGLTSIYNYGTARRKSKQDVVNDRFTVRPELGVIINQKINLLVSGFLPIRLPFDAYSIGYHHYKVSQLTFGVRYTFIQNKK